VQAGARDWLLRSPNSPPALVESTIAIKQRLVSPATIAPLQIVAGAPRARPVK
jgi:hypothetical protein